MKMMLTTVFMFVLTITGRQTLANPIGDDSLNIIPGVEATSQASGGTSPVTPVPSSTSPTSVTTLSSTVPSTSEASSTQEISSTSGVLATSSSPVKQLVEGAHRYEEKLSSSVEPLEISTPKPLITRVGVPFIVDMNLLRSNATNGGKNTALDLGILGGLVRVNMDRRINPATGLRTGPITVSIFGQKIYGNRRRRRSSVKLTSAEAL